MVGANDVILSVDALAGLLDVDHRTGADRRIAGDAPFRRNECAGALIKLSLGNRLEKVLLARRGGIELLRLAEHLLHQLGTRHGAAHRAELVPLLAFLRRGRSLLRHVPTGRSYLRHLVVGIHFLDKPPDVLHPGQRRNRIALDLRRLEYQLGIVNKESISNQRRALGEEIVIGQVVLQDVIVDDLAILDIALQAVALRDLLREIGILYVLIGLGNRALRKGLALIEARNHKA